MTIGVTNVFRIGLLIITYVSDLDSKISNFAAATMIGSLNKTDQGRGALQADLDNLHDWEGKWQFKFSVRKCRFLSVERNLPSHIHLPKQV